MKWPLTTVLTLLSAPVWADGGGLDEAVIRPDDRSVAERLLVRAGFRDLQKSYALIVGVNEFDEFTDLPTAKDPERMRDYLVDEAGFDHVHILTGDKVTKDRLEELMLDDFRQIVGPNDRFLFYWSGHGETLGQGPGARGFLPLENQPQGAVFDHGVDGRHRRLGQLHHRASGALPDGQLFFRFGGVCAAIRLGRHHPRPVERGPPAM